MQRRRPTNGVCDFAALRPLTKKGDMVAGQSMAVEWVKVDKYGSKLGKVLLAGLDCNLMHVKRGPGMALQAALREQSSTDQQSYAAAEIKARAAKLGLWRDADPMALWVFRHKGRGLESLADPSAGRLPVWHSQTLRAG
jgi:endonuclease YncB( thermonuclease family)